MLNLLESLMSYDIMTRQRLIWADSLKGGLILLVILGHALQGTLGTDCETDHVWNIIYSFHMPAFMAVSGWLAFRGSSTCVADGYSFSLFLSVCYRRALQLLVPFVIWTIVSYIIKGEYSIQGLFVNFLYPDRSFWFLWVLFWICVIFNLAQLVASMLKIKELVTILVTCLLLLGVMVTMEIRILGFQFIAYYYLFYTFGYCLHKYEDTVLLKVMSKPYVMVAFTILWACLAWGWSMHGLPSWVPTIPHLPPALPQYAYRGLTGLVAIVVLIEAAPLLLNGNSKFNKMMCSLGAVSLGLYVVHLSIIGRVVDCIQSVIPSAGVWTCALLAFVIVLAISYLVVWIINTNRFTARLFLGKI